jgi:ATP-binding cassette, subfamily C (CFTR/MRP), member 1
VFYFLFAIVGHPLHPSIGFTALTLFNLLRIPLTMFPETINLSIKTSISVKRIESFLNTQDVVGLPASPKPNKEKVESNPNPGFLSFDNVTTAWRSVNDDREKAPPDRTVEASCISKFSTYCSQLFGGLPTRSVPFKHRRPDKKDNAKYKLLDNQDTNDVEMGNIGNKFMAGNQLMEPNDNMRIVLNNLSIVVHPKSFVVIVGSTGSGKSSLLQGMLLGEGVIVNGQRKTFGDLSYSPQSAWIQNATLRDNILFGADMDLDR